MLQETFPNVKTCDASPILKWAGGKTQLLKSLNQHFPEKLQSGSIETYIEPFIGGGSVYFDIYNKFNFKHACLFDINPELIILYNSIKDNVQLIIEELQKHQEAYLKYIDEESRKQYFYDVRNAYNQDVAAIHKAVNHTPFNAHRAAMTIFLNRTCFNGLFRVNSKGEFNVPHGKYKNPTIVFEDKLIAASQALKHATIELADFEKCKEYVSGKTFIYYDPPYRPLSETSQFTSYSKEDFNDNEQIRLANTIKELDKDGVLQLMSNSDPTNYVDDPFFDDLYKGFNISRVNAKRMINSNASKRGSLREILVRNY